MARDAKIGGVFVSLRADNNDFVRATRRAGQELRNVENNMRSVTAATNRFNNATKTAIATFASYISVFAAFNAIQAAGRSITQFETSLARIRGLVGVSKEGVEQLADAILLVSEVTGKSASELAEAGFFITSAGLRGAQAAQVLSASAKASQAGLGETKVVADAATSAMNAYGAANLDAATAVGTLVAAVRLGKAEAQSIAPVLGQVTGAAAELGVAFQQIGAGIAFLTGQGLSASESAIGINAVLKLLVKPSVQAIDVLAQYGLTIDDLREKLGKSDTGLLDLLVEMRQLLSNEKFGKLFRDFNAVNVVLQITGNNFERANEIFKDMADSGLKDVMQAWGEARETFDVQFSIAIARVGVAMQELGRNVLPALTEAVKTFNANFERLLDILGRVWEFAKWYIAIRLVTAGWTAGKAALVSYRTASARMKSELAGVTKEAAAAQKGVVATETAIVRAGQKHINDAANLAREQSKVIIENAKKTISELKRVQSPEELSKFAAAQAARTVYAERLAAAQAAAAAVPTSRVWATWFKDWGKRAVNLGTKTGALLSSALLAAFDVPANLIDRFFPLPEAVKRAQAQMTPYQNIIDRLNEDYRKSIVRNTELSDEFWQELDKVTVEVAKKIKDIEDEFERMGMGPITAFEAKYPSSRPTSMKHMEYLHALLELFKALQKQIQLTRKESHAFQEIINPADGLDALEVAAAKGVERVERILNNLRGQADQRGRQADLNILNIGLDEADLAKYNAEFRTLTRLLQERVSLTHKLRVAQGELGGEPNEAAEAEARAALEKTNEAIRNFVDLSKDLAEANLQFDIGQQLITAQQRYESTNDQMELTLGNLREELRLEREILDLQRLGFDSNDLNIQNLRTEFETSQKILAINQEIADLRDLHGQTNDEIAKIQIDQQIANLQAVIARERAIGAANEELNTIRNLQSMEARYRDLNKEMDINLDILRAEFDIERKILDLRLGGLADDDIEIQKLRLQIDLHSQIIPLQREINDLKNKAANADEPEVIRQLRKEIEQLEDLIERYRARLAELGEKLEENDPLKTFADRMESVWDTAEKGVADFVTTAILEFDKMGDAVKALGRLILKEIVFQLIASPIASGIIGRFRGSAPVGATTRFFGGGAAAGPGAFAGGRVHGLTLVGETGPELVDFRTPSRVYTNQQLGSAMAGGGGTFYFSPVINGGNKDEIRAELLAMFPSFRDIILNDAKQRLARPGKTRHDLQYGVGRA